MQKFLPWRAWYYWRMDETMLIVLNIVSFSMLSLDTSSAKKSLSSTEKTSKNRVAHDYCVLTADQAHMQPTCNDNKYCDSGIFPRCWIEHVSIGEAKCQGI